MLSQSETLAPTTVDELSGIIRRTTAIGNAIYPRGGGTMFDVGLPPTKPGIVIDTRGLDQVVDYPARDMTITVQAGITVARLQEILRTENQRLPIDVPLPEKATIGGAVACNVSGPRRYGFGTLRDYVIGISVVNDRGQEIKAGGRVVKNVAGYDLCKLYTGSFGTLGIITQLTLKVRPAPEKTLLMDLECDSPLELETILDKVHSSQTRPCSITVLSPKAARSSLPGEEKAWHVIVGYEETCEAVDWQVEQLRREVGLGVFQMWESVEAGPIWSALTEYQREVAVNVIFEANMLPHAVPEFCHLAEPLAPCLLAFAGNGIVIGHIHASENPEEGRALVGRLRSMAVELKGNLTLLRCPREWQPTAGLLWGQPRGDWALMKEIKKQLDPGNLFNPGRFVGGI